MRCTNLHLHLHIAITAFVPSRAMFCYIKGRMKRERPPKEWIDNINEYVRLMELIGEAVNLTKDREKWRSLVAASSADELERIRENHLFVNQRNTIFHMHRQCYSFYSDRCVKSSSHVWT